jgi:hypothetical protein
VMRHWLLIQPHHPSRERSSTRRKYPKSGQVSPTPKLPADAEPAVSPVLIRVRFNPKSPRMPSHRQEVVTDRLDGPVGEALKALARRHSDRRKIIRDIDSHRRLRCAVSQVARRAQWLVGLENKSILDELSRRNWLVLDPLSPFRKVVEIEIDGGKIVEGCSSSAGCEAAHGHRKASASTFPGSSSSSRIGSEMHPDHWQDRDPR